MTDNQAAILLVSLALGLLTSSILRRCFIKHKGGCKRVVIAHSRNDD